MNMILLELHTGILPTLFLFIGLGALWELFGERKEAWEKFGKMTGMEFSGDVKKKRLMRGRVNGFDMSLELEARGTSEHHEVYFTKMGLYSRSPLSAKLSLRPEGISSRFAKKLGASEIEIGDPDFDRHYLIKCTDPDLPAKILTPQLKRGLIALKGWEFRWESGGASAKRNTFEDNVRVLSDIMRILQEVAMAMETGGGQRVGNVPRSPRPPGPPKQPPCRHCARPLTFIKEYQRWYCYNCEQYA